MMKKKLVATMAALTLSMVCSLPVMAATDSVEVTESFNWKFYSDGPDDDLSTNSGKKNDDEQYYYLTIDEGNISTANVFGARIRKAADNVAVSPYVLHTSFEDSQKYGYSSTVNTSTLYYLRGKKDDTSTTSVALHVAGKVTY